MHFVTIIGYGIKDGRKDWMIKDSEWKWSEL